MAGTGPADLQALAGELLDACIDALDTIPLFAPGLEGAPERAFVSPGRPALEGCGQLVVYTEAIQDAPTSPGGLNAGRRDVQMKRNHVTFVIVIDRCVIDTQNGADDFLQPLLISDQESTAEQTNADAWALWNHLFNLWRSDQLLTICTEMFFDGMRALPEEGGRAGWLMTLRVILDGYEEFPST